jgi:hypothetical protein
VYDVLGGGRRPRLRHALDGGGDLAAHRRRPARLRADRSGDLFALGIVGRLLAIPVLAGSASYALAELFGWRTGLDLRPRQARPFYAVRAGAIVGGVLIDVFTDNAVRMLFVAVALNGVLAPPLLVMVM